MKKILSIAVVLTLLLCLSAAAFASGEASGGASSEEPYPKFDEYKEYLLETLLQDDFMKASEDAIREALAAAVSPDDENIQRFTGTAEVDQAPPGVVFPLTYDEWYAEFGGSAEGVVPGTYTDGELTLVIADDMTFSMDKTGQNMEGEEFVLTVTGTVTADGVFTVTGLFDGEMDLSELATEEQKAADLATVEAVYAAATASGEPSGEASGEAQSMEDAFVEYIHEWLLNELENNSQMTIEQVEDEFMPLVEQMNFTDFPAEMIYSGMLETGVPMTYEEFVAAGGVY